MSSSVESHIDDAFRIVTATLALEDWSGSQRALSALDEIRAELEKLSGIEREALDATEGFSALVADVRDAQAEVEKLRSHVQAAEWAMGKHAKWYRASQNENGELRERIVDLVKQRQELREHIADMGRRMVHREQLRESEAERDRLYNEIEGLRAIAADYQDVISGPDVDRIMGSR